MDVYGMGNAAFHVVLMWVCIYGVVFESGFSGLWDFQD